MKRILILSYYWPPSGKASLHWPLKIIKHLPEFGWRPAVMTINEDTFSQTDESLVREVSPELEVLKTPVFEPFNIYRKFLGKKKDDKLVASETISKEIKSWRHRLSIWIRMNLFIPDARIGWYPYGVKHGKKILGSNRYDAIASIGPPHSSHLIAKKLAKLYDLKLVPVFIDPWVDIVYYKDFKRSRPTLWLDNKMEKSVLEASHKAVFITESMKNDYEAKYSFVKDKSEVLYWGYNEDSFDVKAEKPERDYEVILHAGNIFEYQNPKKFWSTVKDKIDKGRKLKLKFIGTAGPGIKKSIEEAGLKEHTEYAGFLRYAEMVKEVLTADYLLVCPSEKRHVPGKLFEYLRSGNPIIAFGNDNEEVEKILENANAGMLLPYDSDAKEFFEKADSFETDLDYVKRFDRRNITEKFAGLLD